MDDFTTGILYENIKMLNYDIQSINGIVGDGTKKIDELTDVVLTNLQNNNILVYNSSSEVWENQAQGSGTINDINDINDINNVNITNLQDGQSLVYNSSTSKWINQAQGSGTINDINDINNVNITNLQNNNILVYNSSSEVWENQAQGSGTINDINDINNVNITNLQDGQSLVYNSSTSKWINQAITGGGTGNVLPAPVDGSSVTGITLPDSNLSKYDFRNYTESGGNVIDADGNVIAAIIGGGTSFTSSEGVITSTSNYIEITNPLPTLGGTGHFSIEFYTKMNDPTASWHTYFSYRNDATGSYIQIVIKDDDAWLLEMYHNSTLRQATYRPFPVGAWDSTNFHHFVLTFSGGTTEKLYMDNVEVTKLSNTYGNSITYDANESFERLQISGSQSYDSNIETTKYFRLYDGVLTQEEITFLYNNREEQVSSGSSGPSDVTNYHLMSKNATGTETEWSNNFVDKTTNQDISGFKNFNDFMGIAIGTTQSQWPLRIGSSGPPISGYLYTYIHGAEHNGNSGYHGGDWTSTAQNLIGLYVEEGIRAARLYIMSDRRIKKDIIDIQDDEALNKLRVLQPKKYKYIDPVRGTQEVYGFIAQEVAEVIPYSVRLENSYLPSHTIFCKIINTTVNTSTVDTGVPHTLIVNDFLCFRDNKYNLIEDVKVIEIIDDKTIKVDRIFKKEDTTYTTTTGETDNNLIYLYGKKIDDFHTLNKDTIWTIATAALQEVDRQLQAEKSKTSDLISRLESLEALKLRIEALEARLEILDNK